MALLQLNILLILKQFLEEYYEILLLIIIMYSPKIQHYQKIFLIKFDFPSFNFLAL
jgi:hypothetical protein